MRLKITANHLLPIFLAIVLLAGCTAKQTFTPTATQTPIAETAVPLPSEVITQATDTPATAAEIQADIVLWAPASADPAIAQSINDQLADFAGSNGLMFERREQISSAELGTQVKVVVAMAGEPEVTNVASASPQVQFLAIGTVNAETNGNVHTLQSSISTIEQRAFLAGYILALITPDYRVAVISQAGTEEGGRNKDGFVVGARYYCGLCNARYAPVIYYPLTAEINDPANAGEWQTEADALLASAVTSVYVQPEVSSPELIAYLASAGVKLIGNEGQAGLAEGGSSWVTILSNNPSSEIVQVVSRLLNGESLDTLSAGLDLTQVDSNLITEGKLGLIERIKQDLLAGLIKPLPFGQ